MKEADWTRIVVSAGPTLLRIARRFVRDEASAEDVVAETYLRAWQKRGQLRERRKVLPWLKRICRNCALDVQRRRAGDPIAAGPDLIDGVTDERPPSPAGARQDLLDRLPDSLKSIARLRFVDGMGHSQIAQIERLSTSTVRGRIYMAREVLRKEIEMTAEQAEPKADKWDDGKLKPSPDGVVRWRGARIRLLGMWRPGQQGFYGPSGRRLSRLPKAVRDSEMFREWNRKPPIDPMRNAVVFLQKIGGQGYVFVQGSETMHEYLDRRSIIYSPLRDESAPGSRRRVSTILIGAVIEEPEAAVVYRSDFRGECSVTAIPGWGAAFVCRPEPHEDGNGCTLAVAYSSKTVKTDWAVRALVDGDEEIGPTRLSQSAAECSEGDITGLRLPFPVPPDKLRGIVFRPRWHAKVDWGLIAVPPPAAGPS
jgi:RNA polymerase sigma-70 factor (ECF subfamily)